MLKNTSILILILSFAAAAGAANYSGRYRGSVPLAGEAGTYMTRYQPRAIFDWKIRPRDKTRILVTAYVDGATAGTISMRRKTGAAFLYADSYFEIFDDGVSCQTERTAALSHITRASALVSLTIEAACDDGVSGTVVYSGKLRRWRRP